MKKVLFIVPHLSTGGMPQYSYSLIQKLSTTFEVYCVEYSYIAPVFVVQRNRIIELLGNRFYSLSDGRTLQSVVDEVSPDIVHLQEMPEFFMDINDAAWLYNESRNYFIVETSHDSSFSAENKRWYPDHFALISQYQRNEFQKLNIPIDIVEYDIEYKDRVDRTTGLTDLGLDPNLKHVLNVGLFTPRKNQKEIIEYAKRLEKYPIQFHFVGNTADNFKSYWEPILQNLPSNVKIWGERSDVDRFYSCMDLFLFTSRGHDQDKETSPLVIRESIGHGIPALIYNLPVYLGMYDKYETISYLSEDSMEYNLKFILQKLGIESNTNQFNTLDGHKDFGAVTFGNSMVDAIQQHGESAGMYWGTYIHRELERGGLTISPGDVFLDLGANIGVSTRYAIERGAKTYSVEPDPNMVSLLQSNCPTTTIIQNAISKKSGGTIELYHWPHNPVSVGPMYEVKTISLKDVIDFTKENIIDYLKIDIEGFEETVFDNLPNSYFKRIRQVFIEHHNRETLDRLVDLLVSKNFNVHVEYGNGQDYIYGTNTRFSRYKTVPFQVAYDNTANKVLYSTSQEVENFTVAVRDRDSRAVIWSTQYDRVPADSLYWLIPVPKSFIDFESDPHIGGLIVDLYSHDKLLWSHVIDIKPVVSKPVVTIDNDTEPVFMNYNEFFVDRIYDIFIKGKYKCIVDVGANTGMWLEYMMDKLDDNSMIYAIEPNKKAIDVLRQSYGDRIHLIEKALTDRDAKLTFYVDKDNSLVSSISNYGRPFGTAYEVDGISCKTLWTQITPYTVDLMKIDIEGAEYDLIDSMDSNDFDHINSFLIEYHIFGDRQIDPDVTALSNKLRNHGYNVHLSQLTDTGGFLFAIKNQVQIDTSFDGKKIKAVQMLLTDNNQPQQRDSIANIERSMGELGIEYIQHFNALYVDCPPVSRSRRPDDVVCMNNTGYKKARPGSLTPAHYGCYDSFRSAVLSEFDSDVDYLMVFEGDAYIQDLDVFKSALESVIRDLDSDSSIGYISFGGRYDLDAGYLQSNEISPFNEQFIVTNKIIGCQCIIFPKSVREKLKYNLRTREWDALDIYLNEMCNATGIGMLVSEKTLVSQYNGISVIDGSVKVFKEFPL